MESRSTDEAPPGRLPGVPPEELPNTGAMAARLMLKLCLSRTEAMFVCRAALHDWHMDKIMEEVKQLVKKSAKETQTRKWIGGSLDVWQDYKVCLEKAVPALKEQAFIPPQLTEGLSVTAFMCSHSALLLKDLERLHDLVVLARNLLVSNTSAQHFATETGTDQVVLQLFEVCIRVCARSNDSDPGGQVERLCGSIVAQFKTLLVACLQFLHNVCIQNADCMLSLWLDLFAHRMDYPLGTLVGRVRSRMPDPTKVSWSASPKPIRSRPSHPSLDSCLRVVAGLLDHRCKTGYSTDEVELLKKTSSELFQSLKHLAESSASQSEGPPKGLKVENKVTDSTFQEYSPAPYDIEGLSPSFVGLLDANITKEDKSEEYVPLKHRQYCHRIAKRHLVDDLPMEFAELSDPEDERYELNANERSEARVAPVSETIEAMSAVSIHGNIVSRDVLGSETAPEDKGNIEEEEEVEEEEEEEEDEEEADEDDRDPHGTSYKHRGILAELPLVLGPSEIEALPMIIQAGIWSHIEAKETPTSERLMKAVRCHLLLIRDPGRHILRELLIFIAAWDLQEDELFFQLMVNIMDSVLYHGLLPHSYHSFQEPKDIVSPAQSILIKMLTHIFRRKRNRGAPYNPADNHTLNHLPDQFRFDKQVIGVLLEDFRMSVVPETVALIWLQGKIRGDIALPEDFPLNLWDMERVYEGVYQFLEFFAVLTETAVWKEMLVKHEISFELIALLRELDNSIPKVPLNVIGDHAAHNHSATGAVNGEPEGSAPLIVELPVERPYDTGTTEPAPEALPSPPASPGQEALEEAQEACDFEWRNLKKLVVLVLSSLTWKSAAVKTQIRNLGGVELVMNCCNYDASNPYIREHAVLCLKFLLEDSVENQAIVHEAEYRHVMKHPQMKEGDWEAYVDENGQTIPKDPGIDGSPS